MESKIRGEDLWMRLLKNFLKGDSKPRLIFWAACVTVNLNER